MTINEFKAWLDGYVQAKGGQLNALDIGSIKAKLDEVIAPIEPFTPYIPTYPSPWVIPTTPVNPWDPWTPLRGPTTTGTSTNYPEEIK